MVKGASQRKKKRAKKGPVKAFAFRAASTITYIAKHPVRSAKILLFTLSTFAAVFILFLIFGVGSANRALPDLKKIDFEKLKVLSTKRVKNQFEVRARAKDFQWMPLHRINRDLLYAVVFSEDGKYFNHAGVDFRSVFYAFTDTMRSQTFAGGGSTITQQVARNVFLSKEKSLKRKVKELLLALKINRKYSKNEVLEVYLNIAEFGPDTYGVNMASWQLFDKPPSKINALEGALMALLLPSPRRYHYAIFQNKYLSEDKRKKIKRILESMRNKGFISKDLYNYYMNESLLKRFD